MTTLKELIDSEPLNEARTDEAVLAWLLEALEQDIARRILMSDILTLPEYNRAEMNTALGVMHLAAETAGPEQYLSKVILAQIQSDSGLEIDRTVYVQWVDAVFAAQPTNIRNPLRRVAKVTAARSMLAGVNADDLSVQVVHNTRLD